MAKWFSEEGLAPDSPKEAQLCLLWRSHQRTRSCLNCVTRDLDNQRSQHSAEMEEVSCHFCINNDIRNEQEEQEQVKASVSQ